MMEIKIQLNLTSFPKFQNPVFYFLRKNKLFEHLEQIKDQILPEIRWNLAHANHNFANCKNLQREKEKKVVGGCREMNKIKRRRNHYTEKLKTLKKRVLYAAYLQLKVKWFKPQFIKKIKSD